MSVCGSYSHKFRRFIGVIGVIDGQRRLSASLLGTVFRVANTTHAYFLLNLNLCKVSLTSLFNPTCPLILIAAIFIVYLSPLLLSYKLLLD